MRAVTDKMIAIIFSIIIGASNAYGFVDDEAELDAWIEYYEYFGCDNQEVMSICNNPFYLDADYWWCPDYMYYCLVYKNNITMGLIDEKPTPLFYTMWF